MKKALSVMLTLAMLLSSIVLPVSAETPTETISVGETKTVTLEYDAMQLYLFTPTESCRYLAYSPYGSYWLQVYEGTEIDLDAEVNGNWMTQDYQYDGTAFDAEAGKTYLIRMDNCWSGQTQECELNLIKAQNYESLEFSQPDSSGFPGDLIGVDFTSAPMFASEDLIWTISDPAIAEIEHIGFTGVNVLLKSVGVATLTVTAPSGISASCTVTVKGRETIAFGETKEFTLDYYLDTEEFLFTPTESGRYIVATPYGGPSCGLYGGTEPSSDNIVSSKSWSSDEYSGLAFTAEAGKTYLLSFTSWKDRVIESSVTIMAAATYETLYFKEDYIGRVGEVNGLNVYGTPDNASEAITWTSSNPEVATIFGTDDYGYLELVGPGTAIITATADSGASASCKVTAKEVIDLNPGDTADVTIEPGNYAYFTFTPAESGRYIFYTPNDAWFGFSAEENQNYYPVRGSEWTNADGAYRGDAFELTAGVPYRISAYIHGEQKETVSTQMTLVKAVDFDTFALSRETMNRYVGDYDRVDIVATPNFASEAVTWESSDPAVVSIVGGYDSYTYLDSVGPGTATVTATSATGKVATCTVTVREPFQAEKNVEYTATVDAELFIPIDFTAPEDGTYAIAATGKGYYYVTARNQEGGNVEQQNVIHIRGVRCEFFEMKAGESFRFQLHNDNETETEFCFMVGKDVPATGMTLPITEETVYTNTYFRMYPFFEPILAMEEKVTWESSDPEVICHTDTNLVEYQPGYSYHEYAFQAKKAGTATLTATSENGFQASCVIHVVERKQLELGKHTTKPLCAELYTIGFTQVDEFVFYPETTGEYNLYWEKEGLDESTFFYWNGYYTVLEGTAWENEYFSGIRVQLKGLEELIEPKKELEKLEEELEAMPEGWAKDEKTHELAIKKWEFEELTKETYTSIAVHNATEEPTQITFYLEAYTGEEPTIHFHAPAFVAEKAATFAEDGYKAHYACACGALFADEAGTVEITASDILIPKQIQVESGKAEVGKDAVNDAAQNIEKGGEVSIPVADVSEDAKSAALPVESLTRIAEKEAVLTVEMPAAAVTLDTAALETVAEKAGDHASVTLEVAEIPREDLTETQMAAIKELDRNLVTAISAELLVNGQNIATKADKGFGGGKVTVKIPVKLSGDFTVLYIADDGSVEVIGNAAYENGILTMELEHFSTYAILQDSQPGDVNDDGTINVLDLMYLANYFAKGEVINKANADVNADGALNVLDLMYLANFFAGKETTLG